MSKAICFLFFSNSFLVCSFSLAPLLKLYSIFDVPLKCCLLLMKILLLLLPLRSSLPLPSFNNTYFNVNDWGSPFLHCISMLFFFIPRPNKGILLLIYIFGPKKLLPDCAHSKKNFKQLLWFLIFFLLHFAAYL
jgi:hypothetical protein